MMDLAKNARDLMSGENHEGTPKEVLYADFANRMKEMANAARLESINISNERANKVAAETYKEEIASIDEKIAVARANKPRENMAQAWANAVAKEQLAAFEGEADADTRKKIETRALASARVKFGVKRKSVELTPREIEAINAGALGSGKIKACFDNSDKELLKSQTIPKTYISTASKLKESDMARIRTMATSGKYTLSELASRFGVSATTISNIINS